MVEQRLAGRVAVITGASRGIGQTVARRFAQEGALVAAVARTMDPGDGLPGSLAETVELIRDDGGTAVAVRADLSRADDRRRLVDEVTARLGPVDVLVNNAAASWLAPAATFSEKHFELMMSLQVRAPFQLAQLVVDGMRSRGRGWILNVSSLAAQHPSGPPYREDDLLGTTVYGMCKAALERFSSGLAAECHADGIVVNSLAPSKVVSTWGTRHHHLVPEGDPDAIEYPEEFAEAAITLCAGQAPTGANLHTGTVLATSASTVLDLDGRPFVRPGTVRSSA
ncbi:MAG TPA: SDR family NAD(P)-dependent oxidoreductase [Amycolatopsis sp.]|nr:SDR family NAD(P)-dependent oxidoreductase [Amycolatopsis sp.]